MSGGEKMISFVLPVYNTSLYLEKCVDSLVKQIKNGMEILLIDDGSTDNCPQICDSYAAKYPEQIKVIHKKNAGLSAARNTGIEYAKNKWIAFIDSDDTVADDYVASYIRIITEEDNVDLVLSGYQLVDDNGNMLGEFGPKVSKKFTKDSKELQKLFFEISDNLEDRGWLCTYAWNKLYRKDIIDRYHVLYRESVGYVEDFLFNAEYYMHIEQLCTIAKPNYVYYKHGTGATSRFWGGDQFLERRQMVYEANEQMANSLDLGEDFRKILEQIEAKQIFATAKWVFGSGRKLPYKAKIEHCEAICEKYRYAHALSSYPCAQLSVQQKILYKLLLKHRYNSFVWFGTIVGEFYQIVRSIKKKLGTLVPVTRK